LQSGEILTLDGEDGLNARGQTVLKFSKQFVQQIATMKLKNYELKGAKVNFIVYWLKEGLEQEIKVLLPELYFQKIQQT
jgi:ATP-dependent DNA helicase RecQ